MRVKKMSCKRGHPLEGENVFGRNQCKACHKAATARRETTPASKAYRKQYQSGEKSQQYKRRYYLAHKDEFRASALKRRYGLSVEEFEALKARQDGKCLICGIHADATPKGLVIDHDHKTGKIRGLLCNICNSHIIHTIETYPHLLEKAAKYLEGF